MSVQWYRLVFEGYNAGGGFENPVAISMDIEKLKDYAQSQVSVSLKWQDRPSDSAVNFTSRINDTYSQYYIYPENDIQVLL